MKKYILSPLCSAFVVPGLGQIINRHLKKGLFLLAIVFILFVAGTVKLSLILKSLLTGWDMNQLHASVIGERLQGEDFSLLWALLTIYSIIWSYSVLDAFWTGKKMGSQKDDKDLSGHN